MSEAMDVRELTNYALPEDIAAPADVDPNSLPFEDAPPGWHEMEITTLKIEPDRTFKNKKEGDCVLDQLQIGFRICEGEPHAGASVMDFMPMPSGPMNTMLANRWVSFLHRCGFDIPAGKLVPQGFKLEQLYGRRVLVCVEWSTDGDGRPKLKKNGVDRQNGVKLFGYDDPKAKATRRSDPSQQDEAARAPAAQKSPGAAPRTSRQPAAATAASSKPDFDL